MCHSQHLYVCEFPVGLRVKCREVGGCVCACNVRGWVSACLCVKPVYEGGEGAIFTVRETTHLPDTHTKTHKNNTSKFKTRRPIFFLDRLSLEIGRRKMDKKVLFNSL